MKPDGRMDTVGEQFRKARESRGASVSEAAAATRIKFQHIEAMEQDDFSKMAAAAYARGFIKIYAEFLHLPARPLIDQYTEQYAPAPPQFRLSTPSASSRSISVPTPAPDTRPADASGDAPPSVPRSLPFFAVRIALPVLAIVVVGLVLSTLLGAIARRGSQSGVPAVQGVGAPAGDWIIEEPPDAYLDPVSDQESTP